MHTIARVVLLGILAAAFVLPAVAQPDQTSRADQLATRVSHLESQATGGVSGVVLFLFGAFCALWAQNTKRNPWVWFLLGVLFNIITVLALLAKNAADLKAASGQPGRGTSALVVAILLGVILVTFLLFFLASWMGG